MYFVRDILWVRGPSLWSVGDRPLRARVRMGRSTWKWLCYEEKITRHWCEVVLKKRVAKFNSEKGEEWLPIFEIFLRFESSKSDASLFLACQLSYSWQQGAMNNQEKYPKRNRSSQWHKCVTLLIQIERSLSSQDRRWDFNMFFHSWVLKCWYVATNMTCWRRCPQGAVPPESHRCPDRRSRPSHGWKWSSTRTPCRSLRKSTELEGFERIVIKTCLLKTEVVSSIKDNGQLLMCLGPNHPACL